MGKRDKKDIRLTATHINRTRIACVEGISIVEVVSTLTEEIFIINEAGTAAAFCALSRLAGEG